MTRKQFATRKASLALLHAEQLPGAIGPLPGFGNDLHFASSRGTRVLVKPGVGGAFPVCRQLRYHAAFCSVSAASGSTPSDTCACAGKPKAPGGSSSGQPAHGQQPASPSMERLPVAIKKGDQLLPYVWDGQRITAMSEAALQDADMTTGRLRNWFQGLQRQLKEAFLPDPQDVTPDYWEWLRWRLTQRFFSSTMQNFSFSALLMATGLGAKKAFAASAAINWLLKDGVSRIVRMSVSTSFGQTFDADLKRMRFITSLIFTACMAGEFVTPFWPQHFVALASISSVGRAVGLSAFVATQPAFQAALATGGNLADLTSKNQAQHMVMDMLALGVSAGLTWLCRGMPRGGLLLPAIMYPICAAGDLTCIWHELKAVQLRTLNRERAEMIIERWMRRGAVPSAAEISAAESLVLPSDVWRGLMPLRIAPLDRIAPAAPERLRELLKEYDGEEYVLHVKRRCEAPATISSSSPPPSSASSSSSAAPSATLASAASGDGGGAGGAGWHLPSWFPSGVLLGSDGGGGQPEVVVSLSDRATPSDIAKALLHAAYLRKAVLDHLASRHSEVHQHHHKQLHHHSHHSQQQVHPHAALQSPEDLLHHYHNHMNRHHNQYNHQGHRQDLTDGSNSAPDVISERDVGPSSYHGCNSNDHNGRGQFLGVQQLLHHRHEQAQQQGLGGGAGSDGVGGATVSGHSHDHMHWDVHHHVLYHHSHYHTHGGEGMELGGEGRHHHSHHVPGSGGFGTNEGPLTAAAGAAAARTASLSLSRRHGNGASSSDASIGNSTGAVALGKVDGSGSCCPGPCHTLSEAANGQQQYQQQYQQEHLKGTHLAPVGGCGSGRCGGGAATSVPGRSYPGHSNNSRSSTCSGSVAAEEFPPPRWDRLDEATWVAMIKSSRREADRNLTRLLHEAEQAGWKLRPFMLNTTERVQFVRL
ncbi:hypothetical protein Vafri_11930 [Volvox africanus]|uniref:Protein root UVB sensitive/RUS domain-containing protein n=1 Tax=Volvox africanus TaxID=51714 RepID=A0A8J4B929_9CHLO|nr:hypothetical protein Vafri_11930 [Volvox africanus]